MTKYAFNEREWYLGILGVPIVSAAVHDDVAKFLGKSCEMDVNAASRPKGNFNTAQILNAHKTKIIGLSASPLQLLSESLWGRPCAGYLAHIQPDLYHICLPARNRH